MLTKDICYNGTTITLKSATVRSRLRSFALLNALSYDDSVTEQQYYIQAYVKFLTRSEIAGDAGFFVPPALSSAKDLQRGMDAFLDQDDTLYDALIDGFDQLDTAANDPDLTPDASEKKEPTPA